VDYQLFERLLRDAGQWDVVRRMVSPLDIGELTSRFDAALGSCVGYDFAARRGLERHHALADAHALRTAHYAAETGKRMKL
jgi:hypothetical protein